MANLLQTTESSVYTLAVLAVGIILGILITWILWRIFQRIAARTETRLDDSIHKRLRAPTYILAPVLAIRLVIPLIAARAGDALLRLLDQLLVLAAVFGVAWLVIRIIAVLEDLVLQRYDVTAADNLQARRVHTQMKIVRRILVFIISVIALGVALMHYDSFRELGTGILASAGIAGLVVGLAAQKSLANLLAGLQIAITQPIRLDDVVIVEGEWGRIEEITLTYVVVRIWDQRRLVVPISYFIEKPFQNWTRISADLLGTIYFYMDYTVPVDEIRKELLRILEASAHWDRKVHGVVVTNVTDKAMEVRALVSAADSGKAWDLRCEVREKMMNYLREKYPQALPKLRSELEAGSSLELINKDGR
jgi:small-conductance mechanosensitive channel